MKSNYIPLCVPTWEESEALNEGALYSEERRFYVPADAYLDNYWRWLPRMYDPSAARPVLVPEMLPVTTWEQNVRGLMGTPLWDRMRRHAYRAAGLRCEICATIGPLEAHEHWELHNETCVQKLTRIQALCKFCHKSKHVGYARRLGIYSEVLDHLMVVNKWSRKELETGIQDVYEVWQQRCDWPWTVDMSWLQDQGYMYV